MKKQVNSKKIVHIRSLLIAAILINMGILDACGSSSGTDSVKETTIQETKTEETTIGSETITTEAETQETSTEETIENSQGVDLSGLTMSQQQAVKSAISYLNYSSFSRQGLIDQLSSEYGSNFEKADAEAAVDFLEKNELVDWNEQAAKQAQSYLDYSSFSKQGLIDQLTSEYGGLFTEEQAEYAIKAIGYDGQNEGLDNSTTGSASDSGMTMAQQQAVAQAQSYLNFSAFSRQGLIDQLASQYGGQFEQTDAEYAVKYLEDNGLVDWNEQAVKSAQAYLNVSSFSKDGLIEQLSSEYGGQFTREQAEYAASQVGF